MVPFFQVWSIKQILALFLFSAPAYYRDNWINNAAIIVCVCWCGCQSDPKKLGSNLIKRFICVKKYIFRLIACVNVDTPSFKLLF